MYKCDICKRQFETETILENHFLSHNNNINPIGDRKCPICNRILLNKRGLSTHIKSHDLEYTINRGKSISNGKKEFYNDEKRCKYAKSICSKNMINNNPMKDKAVIKKMVNSRKKYFENMTEEEYSKMVRNFIDAPKKGNAVKHKGKYTPTKIEQIVIDFNIPGLKYNGNKKDSITYRFTNKNYKSSSTPDFIYQDNKKFVETFGVYWHPLEDEEKYIKACEENGYSVLIIWEDKLYNNTEYEKERILKFLEK